MVWHGGIARLGETVNNQIRSVGRVVRRPYSGRDNETTVVTPSGG